jgi:uncharacterized OB-fold protein
MTQIERPLPQPTNITNAYWEAATNNRLVIQECESCGSRQFYPRGFCIACLSAKLQWIDSSGKGSIYTFTVKHRAANSFMKEQLPYVVAIVELDEGVRMLANIVESTMGDIAIGRRVGVPQRRHNHSLSSVASRAQ